MNPPQFFVENKKGEVIELKTLLKGIMSERDQNKRREVIKKVIAHMTLGVDVSILFTDMCLISHTDDIVQKKMIYLYLVNYVESHQEQALMAINTFCKDCKRSSTANPQIRGLALRYLCSLRFPAAIEYILSAIQDGISDPDPYVRKTAVIGLIKLHRYSKTLIVGSSFVNSLYELIRDPDSYVSINAISALNEILEDEGGIAINRRMVIYLLNRIGNYTEFGQSTVFELVSKYVPHGDDEMLDILNILEERLKHSSSSVVLGCIKVFLNYTKDNQLMTRQVYSRIHPPLITLFAGAEVTGSYELAYCVLAHIHLIISKGAAGIFEHDFKSFFCRFDEPTYIKFMKIDILTLIVSENTVNDIVVELSAYVADVNVEISKKSIQGISKIGTKISQACIAIVRQLLSFLSLNIDYVVTETLVAMKDLIRKYRQISMEVLVQIENYLEISSEDEGKAAIIWMIGEFGEDITDAPYIIENLICNLNPNDNLQITHSILSATVRLFLKRAGEMKDILPALYQKILNECDNPDVLDRAGFYYELLKQGPQVAHEILNSQKHAIQNFLEDDISEVQDILTQEFNLLSVIYQKPAKSINQPKPELTVPEVENLPNPPTDLLSLDSLAIGPGSFELDKTFLMDAEQFQELWASFDEKVNQERKLSRMVNIEGVEKIMSNEGIYCIASGDNLGELKFYFFAKEGNSGKVFLVEFTATPSTKAAHFVVKCEDSGLCKTFVEVFNSSAAAFLQTS